MKITEKIYDITTGEESIIQRDETPEEETYRLAKQSERQIAEAEAQAKADAKAVIATRLGLSADELATLLG